MKPIDIKCPQCRENSQLQLETEARMIIMTCPVCNTAMMHYYGETIEIDPSEMERIRGSQHMTTVQGIVRNTGNRLPNRRTAVVRHSDPHPVHRAGAPVREKPFGQDDITNLKIELALAKDVNDFIRCM